MPLTTHRRFEHRFRVDLREVHRETFDDEDRRRDGDEARRGEQVDEGVRHEVRRYVGDVSRGGSALLLGLRRRMVDLEEPNPGRGEPPSPSVVARADDRDLGDARRNGVGDRSVEEMSACSEK